MMRYLAQWGLVAVLAVYMTAAVVGALVHASWINPPTEGTGGFLPRGQQLLVLGLCIGGPFVVAGLLFWLDRPSGSLNVTVWPLIAVLVCLVAGIGAILPIVFAESGGQVTVTDRGFPDRTLYTTPKRHLVFYNARKEPITVCLGVGGDCADDQRGPDGLRGDGLVVAPDHRVKGGTAPAEATVHITLAGPGSDVPNRDAVLVIRYPQE